MFNRIVGIMVVFTYIFGGIFFYVTPAEAVAPPIGAKSAILMDVTTGKVLYEKNPRERRPMASTTKITTAIVTLEKATLAEEVYVSETAAVTGEAAIWLETGERLTVEQLVYAVMLYSANDAAVALAEHVGGTEKDFIRMMNEKAREIGVKDTNYVNPHGLYDPQHYSTAYDLAVLARYGMEKVPMFKEVVSTWREQIPWAGHPWDRVLYNRNKLLKQYQGADGVKTGYIREAGRCLVGSATRNGQQLVAVVLDSPDMFGEVAALLDYGFANYTLREVYEEGEVIKDVKVEKGLKPGVKSVMARDVAFALRPDEAKTLKTETRLTDVIEAPVRKGQKLGQVDILVQGKKVDSIDILAAEGVERKSDWVLLWERVRPQLGLIIGGLSLVVGLGIYYLYKSRSRGLGFR
ncbi:MAG: D-alanyl-D-alanine carboxypeptidase family protein [Thermincolia bacterium]